jgi:hypothetical protein
MQDDFRRAFEAARANYSARDWSSLPPAEQTAAIYKELRLLDAKVAASATAPEPAMGAAAGPVASLPVTVHQAPYAAMTRRSTFRRLIGRTGSLDGL